LTVLPHDLLLPYPEAGRPCRFGHRRLSGGRLERLCRTHRGRGSPLPRARRPRQEGQRTAGRCRA